MAASKTTKRKRNLVAKQQPVGNRFQTEIPGSLDKSRPPILMISAFGMEGSGNAISAVCFGHHGLAVHIFPIPLLPELRSRSTNNTNLCLAYTKRYWWAWLFVFPLSSVDRWCVATNAFLIIIH